MTSAERCEKWLFANAVKLMEPGHSQAERFRWVWDAAWEAATGVAEDQSQEVRRQLESLRSAMRDAAQRGPGMIV